MYFPVADKKANPGSPRIFEWQPQTLELSKKRVLSCSSQCFVVGSQRRIFIREMGEPPRHRTHSKKHWLWIHSIGRIQKCNARRCKEQEDWLLAPWHIKKKRIRKQMGRDRCVSNIFYDADKDDQYWYFHSTVFWDVKRGQLLFQIPKLCLTSLLVVTGILWQGWGPLE